MHGECEHPRSVEARRSDRLTAWGMEGGCGTWGAGLGAGFDAGCVVFGRRRGSGPAGGIVYDGRAGHWPAGPGECAAGRAQCRLRDHHRRQRRDRRRHGGRRCPAGDRSDARRSRRGGDRRPRWAHPTPQRRRRSASPGRSHPGAVRKRDLRPLQRTDRRRARRRRERCLGDRGTRGSPRCRAALHGPPSD